MSLWREIKHSSPGERGWLDLALKVCNPSLVLTVDVQDPVALVWAKILM